MRKLLTAFTAITMSAYSQAQLTIVLPNPDSLLTSINLYFAELTASQTEEFRQTTQGRWLNYLPSPGYSPFTGGFTLSLNLTAPLQELKLNKQTAARIRSIQQVNRLQAATLKDEVTADYLQLQMILMEYNGKQQIEQLKRQAFELAQKQYERHELTPTEYLARQIEWETFLAGRLQEQHNIYKAINNLLLKARKPVHANAPASLADTLLKRKE